jgi:hypothetical protein
MNNTESITMQVTLTEEWINRIADAVAQRIRPVEPQKNDSDMIFDVKGLADYLKSTEAWVRDQARNGNIPCFKSGKYWKFHKRQIDRVYQSRALIPVSTANIRGRA